MVKIIVLCLFVAFNVEHLFQEPKLMRPLDDSIIGVVNIDNPPVYEGDIDVFIQKNINYPITALDDRIEGNIMVGFIVDTLGVTSNHKIIVGLRKDLDDEALRVCKLIQFSKPADSQGKPVKIRYVYTVRFKLPKKKCK